MDTHRNDDRGRAARAPRLRSVDLPRRPDRQEGLVLEDRGGVAAQTGTYRPCCSSRRPSPEPAKKQRSVSEPTGVDSNANSSFTVSPGDKALRYSVSARDAVTFGARTHVGRPSSGGGGFDGSEDPLSKAIVRPPCV